jgi:hypothetical protein
MPIKGPICQTTVDWWSKRIVRDFVQTQYGESLRLTLIGGSSGNAWDIFMKASDDLSRTPTLLDITGMNISDRDFTAQSRELIQVFANLKSREDKAAVLGYARRLFAFTAQCRGERRWRIDERAGEREDRDL